MDVVRYYNTVVSHRSPAQRSARSRLDMACQSGRPTSTNWTRGRQTIGDSQPCDRSRDRMVFWGWGSIGTGTPGAADRVAIGTILHPSTRPIMTNRFLPPVCIYRAPDGSCCHAVAKANRVGLCDECEYNRPVEASVAASYPAENSDVE